MTKFRELALRSRTKSFWRPVKPMRSLIRLGSCMLKPLAPDKWNYAMAAHLLNRAGFGGTPAEIQTLTDLGPDQAVASLPDFELIPDSTPNPSWAKPDPEGVIKYRDSIKSATPEQRRMLQQQQQRVEQQRMMELRGWWMQRMARGPRPFQERMVLF